MLWRYVTPNDTTLEDPRRALALEDTMLPYLDLPLNGVVAWGCWSSRCLGPHVSPGVNTAFFVFSSVKSMRIPDRFQIYKPWLQNELIEVILADRRMDQAVELIEWGLKSSKEVIQKRKPFHWETLGPNTIAVVTRWKWFNRQTPTTQNVYESNSGSASLVTGR